ncbi:hypothetical protein CTI14_69100, partial [Methylobacterium radiotolerans]
MRTSEQAPFYLFITFVITYAQDKVVRVPLIEAIRRQPKEILLTASCAPPSRRRSTCSSRSSSRTR